MLDSSCVYSLITNSDEPRIMKEAINMSDLDS